MSHKPFILYKNVFNSATTATDTEVNGDYYPAFVSDLRPYTWWKAASIGTKYIYTDAGAATLVNTLAILGHNLGTAGATVSVESSTTGAWGGEEVEQLAGFIPTTDLIQVKKIVDATVRYWRLKIISASYAPTIAVLMLGERLDFPEYPDSPFTMRSESINTVSNVSRAGHLLGADVKYTPLKISVKFSWVDMGFVDGDFEDFWAIHGRQMKPFVWVPNITEWPDKAFFVRMPKNFRHSSKMKDMTNAESLDLKFEGIVEE